MARKLPIKLVSWEFLSKAWKFIKDAQIVVWLIGAWAIVAFLFNIQDNSGRVVTELQKGGPWAMTFRILFTGLAVFFSVAIFRGLLHSLRKLLGRTPSCRKDRKTMDIFASILIFLAGGCVALWTWYKLPTASPEKEKTETMAALPMSVEIRTAIRCSPGPLSPYVVVYPSMFGDTLSPIFLLCNIHIENVQSEPLTVRSYSVALSENKKDWADLIPIALRERKTIYSVLSGPSPLPPGSGSGSGQNRRRVAFDRGTYVLGNSTKKAHLEFAMLTFLEPPLQDSIGQTMKPHDFISGWVAFDFPSPESLAITAKTLRVTLQCGPRETDNHAFIIDLPGRGPKSDASTEAQDASIVLVDKLQDLRNHFVKRYSVPFRKPLENAMPKD